MTVPLCWICKRRCHLEGIKRRALFVAILPIAILACGAATAFFDIAAVASQSAEPAIAAEDLLWWLPPDTESVVAARGPFPLAIPPDSDDTRDERRWFTRKASLSEIRLAFEQLPLELAYGLDLRPLRGAAVSLTVQGSRRFRAPLPGFEVMDFEGCSIVVFEKRLDSQRDRVLQALSKKATRQETIAGTQALVFHQQLGQAQGITFLQFHNQMSGS